ncbi:MAG: phosphoglycerate mutase family protein [Xanthomonadales bacterium]|nr:phosphoglycerate mutase family protein [Xanthomonadales bacterium]
MSARLLLLLLSLMMGSASVQAEAVFFLVRHAEKNPEPEHDPHLSTAGKARAETLAALLEDAGIGRIFSSDYSRTRETAAPLANRLGLEIEPYDPRRLEPFAEELLEMQGRVLVVGHSNTTPQLVRLLGGDAGPPIDEKTEYDRIYVIVVDRDTTGIMLRYGHAAQHLETVK